MSTPIGDSAIRQATTDTLKKAPSTALGIFSLAALGTAAWMMKDSYNGSRDRITQQVTEVNEENDVAYSQYGWGHWSGNPALDNLAHRWFGFKQYGPFDLFEKYQDLKIRVSGFFSNVVTPNLIPLGLGLAGAYGALGADRVHQPFKAFYRWATGTNLLGQVAKPLGQLAGQGLKLTGQAVGSMLSWPFQSLTHLGIGSGVLLGGAYFLQRFSDAYGHDGQRSFFRNEIYNTHGVE